jgi:hypothetical protein
LGAAAAVPKAAGDVGGGDGPDRLDPRVSGGRGDHVAAGAADPQSADALGVDQIMASREVRHRSLEVLDPVRGILQPARLSLALALVGGIECECHETLARQPLRIQPGGLLLDAAAAGAENDRRVRYSPGSVGDVQVSGEVQPRAREGYVRPHS